MQLDMHYYATYALARAAGISPEKSLTIAKSAQFVDDSSTVAEASADGVFLCHEATAHHPAELEANATKDDQRRVWVPFHFLPGGAGNTFEEKLICQKDSQIAREMVGHAISLGTKSYGAELLGITAHVYADTFSHYGFSGITSELNKVVSDSIDIETHSADVLNYIKGKASEFFVKRAADAIDLLALGHGSVATYPDRPYLSWSFSYEDGRASGVRSNATTFMAACEALYNMFVSAAAIASDWRTGQRVEFSSIKSDIEKIIRLEGKMDERVEAWQQASKKGLIYTNPTGEPIPGYSCDEFSADVTDLVDKQFNAVSDTDVYLFMQAAKVHREYVLHELLPIHGIKVMYP